MGGAIEDAQLAPHTPAADSGVAARWHRLFVRSSARQHAARAAFAASGVFLVLGVVSTAVSWLGWRTCTREDRGEVCSITYVYPFTVQPKLEMSFVNGLPHGTRREWFVNGQLWIEGDYAEGRRRGVWREFWPNGAPRFEGTYRNDVLDGTETWFWPSGVPEWQVGRRAGSRDGEERWWYDNGELRRVGSYVDGVRDGPFTLFAPDGAAGRSGAYIRGALVSGPPSQE